jgi:hypothetical protein
LGAAEFKRLFFLLLVFAQCICRAEGPSPGTEPLCQYVMRRINAQSDVPDRPGLILQAITEYGNQTIQMLGLTPGETYWDKLLAPRGMPYSFHGIGKPLWALALPKPGEPTPWDSLTLFQRRDLVERLRKRIVFSGNYDWGVKLPGGMETVAGNENDSRFAGLNLLAFVMPSYENSFSQLPLWKRVSLLALDVFDSSPLLNKQASFARENFSPKEIREVVELQKVVPTLLSPSAYFANASAGGGSGLCRHGACGAAGLLGELGMPNRHVQVQMGRVAPFLPLGGHAWMSYQVVPFWPHVPVEATPSNRVTGGLIRGWLPMSLSPLGFPFHGTFTHYDFLAPFFSYDPGSPSQ